MQDTGDANTNKRINKKSFMRKTHYLILSLLLFIAFSSDLSAQSKSQNRIAAQWEDGEYKNYVGNGYGMFMASSRKLKVEIKKNDKGLATQVIIDGRVHDVWQKSGSEWSSGFSKTNNTCLFFTDDGNSIVKYELNSSSNTVSEITGFINKKAGKAKAVTKMINSYLAQGIENMQAEKDALAAKKAEHKAKYSIGNKTVEKISIELLSDDKIDCGAKFFVAYTIETEDGSTIKSRNLGGEAYPNEYDIEVRGAQRKRVKKANGDVDYEYTAEPYCDAYTDKTLVVIVKAIGKSTEVDRLTFPVNCTIDPAVAAAEKKRQELLAKEREAEKERERQRLLAQKKFEQQKANGEIVSKPAASSKTGNKMGLLLTDGNTSIDYIKAQDNDRMLLNVARVNNETLLVGGDRNAQNNAISPAIYSYSNSNIKKKYVDFASVQLDKKETFFTELVSDGSNHLLASGTGILVRLQKTSDTYKVVQYLDPKKLGTKLIFKSIQKLSGSRCVALGYEKRNFDTKSAYAPSKIHLVFWDYKTGKFDIHVLTEDASLDSKMIRTKDGNIVISVADGRYSGWKETSMNLAIHKIDASNSKQLRFIWTQKLYEFNEENMYGENPYPITAYYKITDMLEDDNGDIVFALYNANPSWYLTTKMPRTVSNNDYQINSTSVGIGRVNSSGKDLKISESDHLNVSYWGGSDRYTLESKYTPGAIYYSGDNTYTKLMKSPKGNGYLLTANMNAYGVTFPKNKGFRNKHTFNNTCPALIYFNQKDLSIESFDFINIDLHKQTGSDEYVSMARSKKKNDQYQIKYVQHNLAQNKLVFFDLNYLSNAENLVVSVKPEFNQKWAGADLVSETESELNLMSKMEKLLEEKGEKSLNEYLALTEPDYGDSEDSSDGQSDIYDNYVRLVNNTGNKLILINDMGNNTDILSGRSSDVRCSTSWWIARSAATGNVYTLKGRLVYKENSACGKEFIIE